MLSSIHHSRSFLVLQPPLTVQPVPSSFSCCCFTSALRRSMAALLPPSLHSSSSATMSYSSPACRFVSHKLILPSPRLLSPPRRGCGLLVVQAKQESLELKSQTNLSGVVFQPFSEVQPKLSEIASTSKQSLARQRFTAASEAAINEQINVEYNISYVYHALFAYFDRDNVALPGLAKFFKDSSDEEREHAELFMKYQNLRGGRVKLQAIMSPEMEFDHSEKGDALHAMELALSLEKLNYEKLLNLTKVAEEEDDPQMQDFIESNFLGEQVEAIKKISEYVSQLRRVGKGHGVYHFDRQLQ